MHLTKVVLPAPLSPTNAVTSPGWIARSTSCRTCTGPKVLFTALSSKIGLVTASSLSIPPCPPVRRLGHPEIDPGRPVRSLDAELVASGLGVRHTDLGCLHPAGIHHMLDVLLGDQDRVEQHRLDRPVGLGVLGDPDRLRV